MVIYFAKNLKALNKRIKRTEALINVKHGKPKLSKRYKGKGGTLGKAYVVPYRELKKRK